MLMPSSRLLDLDGQIGNAADVDLKVEMVTDIYTPNISVQTIGNKHDSFL